MRHVARILLLGALACGALACASNARGERRASARQSDVITLDEITRGHWRNAYDMIRALRGHWLNDRAHETILGEPTEIQVHLDDMRLGGVASLRTVAIHDITSARFHRPIEASARWGLGYGKGAIELSTRVP